MEVTVKFESAKDFFEQLPRFAALISFSGQFASFTEKPGDDHRVQLETPDLPAIDQPAPDRRTVHPTSAMTAEEAGQKIEKAFDVAEAVNALNKPAPEAQEEKPAEAPPGETKEPKAEEPKEAKPEEPKKPKPEETPVDIVDVRAALNKLIKTGKRDKTKEILQSFGAENLSAVKEKDYWLVLSMAQEALGDV